MVLRPGSALAGSGAALSFDNRKTAGAYTIPAMNVTTECTAPCLALVNIGLKSVPNSLDYWEVQ